MQNILVENLFTKPSDSQNIFNAKLIYKTFWFKKILYSKPIYKTFWFSAYLTLVQFVHDQLERAGPFKHEHVLSSWAAVFSLFSYFSQLANSFAWMFLVVRRWIRFSLLSETSLIVIAVSFASRSSNSIKRYKGKPHCPPALRLRALCQPSRSLFVRTGFLYTHQFLGVNTSLSIHCRRMYWTSLPSWSVWACSSSRSNIGWISGYGYVYKRRKLTLNGEIKSAQSSK